MGHSRHAEQSCDCRPQATGQLSAPSASIGYGRLPRLLLKYIAIPGHYHGWKHDVIDAGHRQHVRNCGLADSASVSRVSASHGSTSAQELNCLVSATVVIPSTNDLALRTGLRQLKDETQEDCGSDKTGPTTHGWSGSMERAWLSWRRGWGSIRQHRHNAHSSTRASL